MQFDDLNPGTETGDLVNTMLSGMGPDVAALLTAAFNGDLHEMVDTLVVNSVNSYLRCDTIADNGEPIFGTDLVDMIDFSGLFEKFYGMFSDVYIKRWVTRFVAILKPNDKILDKCIEYITTPFCLRVYKHILLLLY